MSTRTPLPPPAIGAAVQSEVIRVPRSVGLTVVQILGKRCGAVVDDPGEFSLYFFVPAGSGARWDVLGSEAVERAITIPPSRRTAGPGPRWRVCPGSDVWHTDPGALQAAVEDAHSRGPR